MSFTKLASLPAARGFQVASDAVTQRIIVDTNEQLVDVASELRAYFMLQNTTTHTLRYFYKAGDFAQGFTVLPKCGVRIVARNTIYLQFEAGSGVICFDRAEG
jgi:hypothetical protein